VPYPHRFAFFPNPFTTPFIHSTLLRVFSSVPLHSRETTPSSRLVQVGHAGADVVALTPHQQEPPSCRCRFLAAHGGARAGLTSLIWQWLTYLRSALR